MDYFYLIIVIVLFALAFSDIIVGVSNDAVNFLNSAVGSKAAPFKVIMLIAALGVLVGATFSSGMMEVAKKGLFHPETFSFHQIMVIFLAVMITDVLLLDLFNTFGLPTSTTVSLVFELLGASVAIALVTITNSELAVTDLNKFINSAGALVIISGILLSVAFAFSFGLIVQFVTRVIFSFNYKRTVKYFGSLWGGLAITSITYFILIKGAKGSAFLSNENIEWINSNSYLILSITLGAWVIVIQLLQWFTKINVFKIVVLFGTFALSMAFAGNDLVNFVGVPIAGYEAFKIYSAQNILGPDGLTMEGLNASVSSSSFFLIVSGILMVITLWFSRKARTVLKTQLNLSQQDEVTERFSSSVFSRALVRQSIKAGDFLNFLIPERVYNFINSRFNDKHFIKQKKKDKEISFDLIRASVNLTVASSLIAFATSFKLPLSTTYVTFMTAMGTSLADRAWGRESAVYRVTGVIVIIGGWFFTAFSAFVASFLIAIFIYWGGQFAIIAVVLLSIFIVYKTHGIHKKREKEIKISEESTFDFSKTGVTAFEKCNLTIISSLIEINEFYKNVTESFINEKRKKLGKTIKEINEFDKKMKSFKKNVHQTVQQLNINESNETGDFYVQIIDYLREIAHCLTFLSKPIYDHIDNNHAPLEEKEKEDLKVFLKKFTEYTNEAIKIITGKDFSDIEKLNLEMNELLALLNKMRKDHLKNVKNKSMSTRLSMLYIDVLFETKNLVLYIINLSKTTRDFAEYHKEDGHTGI